jgi:lipoprotein NlpI
MDLSVRLAGLALLFAVLNPVLAQTQATPADNDQCRFAGHLGDADANIAACDRAISDPGISTASRAAALSNRCGWRWTKKDSDSALADCNEAIKLDPGLAVARINRGNVYLMKADAGHALDDFNAAVRLDPKSGWAYSARGDLYENQGDFARALADLNESIRLEPEYAMAYFFRSNLYKNQGDTDRALADLNQSIRFDPNFATAHFNRGCLSYLTGNDAAALADFNEAIRLDPGNQAAYFNRGVAYFVIGGRIADAEADFKKASELNPADAYAALWLDLAERRNSAPGHLTEAAKQLDMTAWPAPLVRQFLGQADVAQTLAAAYDRDPKTSVGQTCEADYYGGEFELTKKNKPEAMRLLGLAAHDCPHGFIESTAAIAELIVQGQ